jgi:hypothetical protein
MVNWIRKKSFENFKNRNAYIYVKNMFIVLSALYTNSYLLFYWRKQYFSSKQNFIRKQGGAVQHGCVILKQNFRRIMSGFWQ